MIVERELLNTMAEISASQRHFNTRQMITLLCCVCYENNSSNMYCSH